MDFSSSIKFLNDSGWSGPQIDGKASTVDCRGGRRSNANSEGGFQLQER